MVWNQKNFRVPETKGSSGMEFTEKLNKIICRPLLIQPDEIRTKMSSLPLNQTGSVTYKFYGRTKFTGRFADSNNAEHNWWKIPFG